MAAKKNRPKKDKDYTMIIVLQSLFICRQSVDGFGFMNEVRLTCFPKTIAFISKCFNWDK